MKAANAFTPGGLSKLPKKDPSPTPSAAPSEAGDAAPKKNPLAKLKSAVTKISAANAFGKAAPNMAKKPPSAAPSRAGSVMGEPAPSIASLGGFKKAAGSKPPSRAVSVMGDENDDPAGMKKGAKSVKGSSRATTPAGKDGTVAGSAPHSPAKSVKSKAAEDLPEVKGAPPPMDAINQRIAALEDLARHSLGASGIPNGAPEGDHSLGAGSGGIPYKNYSEQRRMREELEDMRYRMRNMEEFGAPAQTATPREPRETAAERAEREPVVR